MGATVIIHGIKACDTLKKAQTWLDAHGVAYDFHDYKKAGIDQPRLETWVDELGWEAVLNRAGTTFRALPEADQSRLRELVAGPIRSETDLAEAVTLLTASPGMATARQTLSGYADAAAAELALLPDSSAKDALASLVRYVMDRTR